MAEKTKAAAGKARPRAARRGGDSAGTAGKGGKIDRRHWAARIGVSFNALKNPAFRAMYPFESHLHKIGRYTYHYLDEGEGEPVVMVHGNPTWSFFYRNLILGLRDGYRCLVPDHLGCGLSEKPQNYDYNLENHIINLEDWLEKTLPPPSWNGGRINLIVHDWGGPIGLGYAVRHPERIRRLVILNTSAFTAGTMPLRIRMCRWPVLGPFMVRRLNLFASLAAEMTTVKRLPYRIQKAFTMPYNSYRNRVGVNAFVQDIPLEKDTPTHKILRKIEDNIQDVLGDRPMLVQWGMKDWCFTPFFLKLWRKRFPRAEVDEHHAGHYLLEDEGDMILLNIRSFLERAAP